MARLEDLAERVERLVLRHVELRRTAVLVEQQLAATTAERDSLRSRLAAARARIDALLQRLPAEGEVRAAPPASADSVAQPLPPVDADTGGQER